MLPQKPLSEMTDDEINEWRLAIRTKRVAAQERVRTNRSAIVRAGMADSLMRGLEEALAAAEKEASENS